jgi:hypothetical protein
MLEHLPRVDQVETTLWRNQVIQRAIMEAEPEPTCADAGHGVYLDPNRPAAEGGLRQAQQMT